jgi:hypothetical protein
MPHIEAVHAPEALLAFAQARPHMPQCAVLVRVSVSQPLAALPSQSAKPVPQVKPQRESAQRGDAFMAPAQAMPQPPQWSAVARVSTSLPLVETPSQSAKPVLHVVVQRPSVQRPEAPAAPMHWSFAVHSTQRCATTSQREVPVIMAQSVSAPHPLSQRSAAAQ